jgi:hypothetical protein
MQIPRLARRVQPGARPAPSSPRRAPSPGLNPAVLAPVQLVRDLELDRRARLVRIITLGLLALTALLIPAVIPPTQHPGTAIAVGLALLSEIGAYALNRQRFVNAAAFTLLGGLTVTVAWEIVTRVIVNPAIDLVDLRLYAFLLLPILLSCVLTGPRGPVIMTSLVVVFTVVSLLFLRQSPPLHAYWGGSYPYETGGAYDVVAVPVVLEVLTGIVAWLGADSIRRVLLSASKADDLSQAYDQILRQAQEREAHRQRLQQGIAEIQQVHAAIARGQWDARARSDDPELLPIAISLNLLLDRLQRMGFEETGRMRMEAAAHELAGALRRVWAGEPYTGPEYTGTALDEVLLEFTKLRTGPPGVPSRPPAQPPRE